jgi:hypothetical protein
LIALLIGLGLFVLLIARTGPSTILATVRNFGTGFLLLILISGMRHVLRTVAWYRSIEPDHRQVTLVDLFNIRLAAEAVSDLTFLGPVLGETVRTAEASKRLSAPYSLSSVLIEDLIYGLSAVLFILSGVFILVFIYPVPHQVKVAGVILCLALILLILTAHFVIGKRRQLLGGFLDRLKKLNLTRRFLEREADNIRLFEDNVYGFYRRHKRLFFSILLFETAASMTGVMEAYVILNLTTLRSSLSAAYVTEAVNRAVNLIFAFVPLRVGVEEGGAGLVLGAVGYSIGEGVSLAIIRKIRTLFWMGVGLFMVGRYSVGRRTQAKSSSSLMVASE